MYSWDWNHGGNAGYFHDLCVAVAVWKISILIQGWAVQWLFSYTTEYSIFRSEEKDYLYVCSPLDLSGIDALLEQVLLSDFPYILYIFLSKSCLRILLRYAYWNALSKTHSTSSLFFCREMSWLCGCVFYAVFIPYFLLCKIFCWEDGRLIFFSLSVQKISA